MALYVSAHPPACCRQVTDGAWLPSRCACQPAATNVAATPCRWVRRVYTGGFADATREPDRSFARLLCDRPPSPSPRARPVSGRSRRRGWLRPYFLPRRRSGTRSTLQRCTDTAALHRRTTCSAAAQASSSKWEKSHELGSTRRQLEAISRQG